MRRGSLVILILIVTSGLALADPPSSDSSPQIWSIPEAGQPRDESAPLPPPPPPENPPPYYYRHRRYMEPPPKPDTGDSLTELGLTLGPPTIVNVNVGYWGPQSLPIVLRLSGMYYGDTRGVQFDAGYVFYRDSALRQFVALSAISYQASADFYGFSSNDNTSFYKDMFSGIGPTYGLNWHGLAVQAGVAFGQDVNVSTYSGGSYYTDGGNLVSVPPSGSTTSQFWPAFLFQVGYTFLW